MKVLFVTDVSIAKVIGGAERVLYEQSIRLVRRGYDVHIMTRCLPGHPDRHEQINGVKEWRYEINQSNAVSYLKSTRENSKRLFETLQSQNKFDVIIFQQPFSALGVVQSPLGRNIRKLYVCFSLSFEEFISRNKKPEQLTDKFIYKLNAVSRKYLEKKALKNSDQIIVLSQFTIDKLNNAYKIPSRKYAIIPGGVDLDRFHPAVSKAAIREKFLLPDKGIILFTVRNLVPRMGLENLIQAMSEVLKSSTGLFLVIGGTGPLKDKLMEMARNLGIQNYIRFVDFIPEESLPNYYQMADIFILPTKELEGFGLVTLEAMASGVPVLGTPVGGTKEIISRFDTSFMFKDTTPESMASLILEKYHIIKNHPEEWQKISIECRRFAEENYSWDKHVEELEKHF